MVLRSKPKNYWRQSKGHIGQVMKNGYSIARFEKTAYIRVYGLANLKNAPVLSSFMETEIADGVAGAYMDLAECRGMDSTFMGTMVAISNNLDSVGGGLVISNPTEHCARLLDMLGVAAVIPVRDDVCIPDANFVPLDCDVDLSHEQRMGVVKKAHEHLIALSKENESKFRPIIQAFEKEMDEKKDEVSDYEAPSPEDDFI
ncbi:MAG: STAS domain-containing protein [Planctomycetes bacterium]|nr:STAS domain-containing protein [Planctomycetota bacterium]